ncbi:MAG: hypothetical protein KF892_08500 [Rhizobacter sp.]|nr:hypothetical protein [Rhizobacter sp.]
MPKTLTPFKWLLEAGSQVIRCPRMFLDGWYEHQPPIFEGSGRFIVETSGSISFELDAVPRKAGDALEAIRRVAEQPFARESAMRLRGIDYAGTEWNAGWVLPQHGEIQGSHWQLFGEAGSLNTDVQQLSPSDGVELAYAPPPNVPFTEVMRTTAHLGEAEIGSRTQGGRHQMEILGSHIEVMSQPWTQELWIRATTSDELTHPYLENWLSEPLRALRGRLIFPRLVARNCRDGKAFVSLRTTPALGKTLGGCAIQLKNQSPAEFWSFYEHYLTYVARHRNKRGSPEFEANSLTRLHDEVIQARTAGSHWVIALCVASAIEGVIKLDPGFKDTPAEFAAGELESTRKLIAELSPPAVRSRLNGAVAGMAQASPARYLADRSARGLISQDQIAAWKNVRNRVAHGNLFEPWGTEQEHTELVQLIELFYRLTSLRIGYLA